MGPLVLEELFRGVHEVAGESGRQLRYSFRVGPLILEEVLRRHHRRDQLHIGRQAKNGWRTANRAIRESLIPTNEISFMLTIKPLTKSGVIAANCLSLIQNHRQSNHLSVTLTADHANMHKLACERSGP